MLRKKTTSVLLAAAITAAFLLPTNVQAAEVQQQYIHNNRSYQALNPIGLTIHDTDNEGATAQNNRDYFNRVYVGASAHYFVDWNNIIQTVPNSEKAWHAGPTANRRYLSIEMCEPRNHNQEQFNTMYQNTVELAADLCKQYNWNASNINSHAWCSATFRETDHEDPIEFLKDYGKSWDILLNDIQRAINGQTVTIPSTPAPDEKSDVQRAAEFVGGRCTELQQLLIAKGYSCGGYGADGRFGRGTYSSLIKFQGDAGLVADGLAGPKTFTALKGSKNTDPSVRTLQHELNVQGFGNLSEDGIAGSRTLGACPLIKKGANGNITRWIQMKVGVNPDGKFGNDTRQAVMKFQRVNNLSADGVVGQATWKALLGL